MNPPIPPNMISQLELLEEKFTRVERESERRVFDGLDELEQRDSAAPRKHHKKQAVSISQFGKQEAQGHDGLHSPLPSPLSAVATKSTFYHTLANPRSVDSLVSDSSEQDTPDTEEAHELQVERITGCQSLPRSVGALLPRRLTRAQSQLDYVSMSNKSMVIDVSVETTTELSRFPPDLHMSTAYATRPSRPRAATVDVLNLASHVGLMERAKGFARKLRQKNRAEVP